jgi:putative hydrolase of the HAD superfamily
VSIRTVVFDFGNVLGCFNRRKSAEQLSVFGPPGTSVDDIISFLYDTDLEFQFEMGRLSSRDVLGRLRERFDLAGSDEQLTLAYTDMFWPNEPVCSFVSELRGRCRLVLLSNTNALHYRHFRRQFAATLDCFDELVASHEVGFRKPDSRIFQHVEEKLSCTPGECLFIDDLPENIEAARARGWHGVVYHPEVDLRQRLRQVGLRLAG